MSKKKYYLVVDVETFPDNGGNVVHDIGLAIMDRTGMIYESASFLNSSFWDPENLSLKLVNPFTLKHLPAYAKAIRAHDEMAFKIASPEEIKATINRMAAKCDYACAYNATFDFRAIKHSFGGTTLDDMQFIDIWHVANEIVTSTKGYQKFAVKNGFLTEKGNLSTKAEHVYSYIAGIPNFVEKHTGLEDVYIECQILTHCFNKKVKMTTNKFGSWQTPQKIFFERFARKKGQ